MDVGDMVRWGNPSQDTASAAFTNLAGVATDPTTVTLVVQKPDGSQTVYAWPTPGVGQSALTRESAGRFYSDQVLDMAGKWQQRLAGTGAVTAASESSLRVDRQRVIAP